MHRYEGGFDNFLLDSLPPATTERLLPHLREVELAIGEQLYQQDVIPPAVYFPVTAVISKYQILEEGSVIEVALAGSEGAVGLAPTMVLKGSVHYSEVLIGGRAYKISAGRVLELCRRDGAFRRKANVALHSHLQQVSRRLICNQYHTLEPRLATWLMMVAERQGSSTVRVTHDQIGRSLGYFRPTVSVALHALKEQGALTQSRGKLNLIELRKLSGLACECLGSLSLGSLVEPLKPSQRPGIRV